MKFGSQDQGRYSQLDKSQFTTNLKTNPSYPSPNYDLSNPKNNTVPNTVPNTGSNAEYQRIGNANSNGNGYQNLSKKLNFHEQPRYNYNDVKAITKDSQRRILGAISMSDLFKQNVENRDMRESSYTKIFNSANRTQQIEGLHNQHRLQVQKLLLQISRLHDVIYDLERSKKFQIQRIKQQCEQVTYLHISNIKQSQFSQLQILQSQLKKTKQALQTKSTQFQQLHRTTTKQKQLFKSEIQILRNNVKELINKKNEEVFEIKQENEEKIKQLNRSNNNAIEEMKEMCDREIKKLYKQLQDKEDKVLKLQEEYESTFSRNGLLEDSIEKEKILLEQKLSQYAQESNKRYHGLMQHVTTILNEQQLSQSDKQTSLKQVYEVEIANLMKIIKLKGQQNVRINSQLETQRVQYRLLRDNIQTENEELLKLLRAQKLKNLQQLQILKSKMAILHENDIKQLVHLYQTKIECLNQQLSSDRTQKDRIREFMHDQRDRWYSNKKKYQQTISKLNVQILRLKSGIGNIEKQMKDRIQNERSAMLLTSKSLIRGVQLQNTNTKFYEEQLRKLRLTIQRIEKGSEQNENTLKSQIKYLQQQILQVQATHKQNCQQWQKTQQHYLQNLESKQLQTKKLSNQLTQLQQQTISLSHHKQIIQQYKQQIERLNKILNQKNQKIKQLQNRIEKLQHSVQEYKVQNEQLYLQNQINHEEAKQEYEKIAIVNMKSLKEFYERKVAGLEGDLVEVRKCRELDVGTIGELVRKYQVMEECMGRVVRQSQRRSKLEERVMELGMDQNLVKNMGEIFNNNLNLPRQNA